MSVVRLWRDLRNIGYISSESIPERNQSSSFEEFRLMHYQCRPKYANPQWQTLEPFWQTLIRPLRLYIWVASKREEMKQRRRYLQVKMNLLEATSYIRDWFDSNWFDSKEVIDWHLSIYHENHLYKCLITRFNDKQYWRVKTRKYE
jgi:hypothetical protein